MEMASIIRITSNKTSKTVGKRMVRIPWNTQMGIINCPQTRFTVFSQIGAVNL
jgi:hypothetical protein